MSCCGHPSLSYAPPLGWPPAKARMVGENGFILVKFVGLEPRAQFGAHTGVHYPFDASATLYVDARDFDKLREVERV